MCLGLDWLWVGAKVGASDRPSLLLSHRVLHGEEGEEGAGGEGRGKVGSLPK